MSTRRRLTLITYFLAVAIFLLTFSGDGSAVYERLKEMSGTGDVSADPDLGYVQTERLLMEGTPWETVLYITESFEEGPTVMVVGGVHGDEPAGYLAADSITTWAIDRGTLLVLPRANASAIAARTRNAPVGSDLNRVFPGTLSGEPTEILAALIFELLLEYEPVWVIDLHEAENFEREFPGALGQTLIFPEESASHDVANELLKAVNRTIGLEEHHFILLRGAARGSLIEVAQLRGSDSIIIETCTKMPIAERMKYHRQVVSSLLYLLDITVY